MRGVTRPLRTRRRRRVSRGRWTWSRPASGTRYNALFARASGRCGLAHRRGTHFDCMRVAIITESFPPDINGVAHSVVRVAEHLVASGHEPLVIAPEPASGTARVAGQLPYPVVRVPSMPMPGYPSFPLGLPRRKLTEALVGHGTELVHLASAFFLGARGSAVAQRLGPPPRA